jgi:hypothetical protein
MEISLGNRDIVEALLDLGHPLDGSARNRPIEAAVVANNEELFWALVHRGASLILPGEEERGQPSLFGCCCDTSAAYAAKHKHRKLSA